MLEGGLGAGYIFPFIVPFCRFLYYLLKEKETKIKESMKIMGLTEGAYFASWLFHYFVYFTLITCVLAYMLGMICDDSSFMLLWLWLWVYAMVLFSRAVLVSALFSTVKMGLAIGIGVWLVEAIIHDFVYANKANIDP